MKILVSDVLADVGVDLMRAQEGIEVDVRTGLSPDELKEIIGAYDALAIRSATQVTADLLDAAKNLKVVARAGIGLDNVDIPEATKKGVVVMNTPGGNVITTAEHTIAMILSLSRNIPAGTASLKAGRWDKKALQGREICNKVLGLVGYGKIGSIVADRARGLKMKVVVYDPFVTPEQIEKAGFESVSLEALYQRADYISVHVPKIKETVNLINADAFSQMKDGVMVINCARGGIVNEEDLHAAITSGKVAGAALDVFALEPPGDHPLMGLDQVICTPHLGASTREAQVNVAVAAAEQILAYLQTGTILNAVNVPSVTGELLVQLSPYLTLGERMGCLQAQLSSGPITELTVEYTGDFKGLDLSPVTSAILKGLLAPMVKYDVNFINAAMIAKDQGIKVIESAIATSADYLNLISVRVTRAKETTIVEGTLFGKKDPRIVKINNFRLEMVPDGHMALIYNVDRPGSIGEIGTLLGRHDINIGRMHVGQEEGGDRNIIFLTTDTPIPEEVFAELQNLPLVRYGIPLEL